jgi:hypothetical protein
VDRGNAIPLAHLPGQHILDADWKIAHALAPVAWNTALAIAASRRILVIDGIAGKRRQCCISADWVCSAKMGDLGRADAGQGQSSVPAFHSLGLGTWNGESGGITRDVRAFAKPAGAKSADQTQSAQLPHLDGTRD